LNGTPDLLGMRPVGLDRQNDFPWRPFDPRQGPFGNPDGVFGVRAERGLFPAANARTAYAAIGSGIGKTRRTERSSAPEAGVANQRPTRPQGTGDPERPVQASGGHRPVGSVRGGLLYPTGGNHPATVRRRTGTNPAPLSKGNTDPRGSFRRGMSHPGTSHGPGPKRP
jgi:hypothetical protein